MQFEDRKCPNAKCCQKKGLDGCYECGELYECEKGFYSKSNDGAAAVKAQALYIQKYGKEEFLKLQNRLHEKFAFQKIQEILGQDTDVALKILEEN